MALHGIKVIELAGLAPGPFCGLILSDFGASVIRVDKTIPTMDIDELANGKQSISLNLKTRKGVEIFRKLCNNSDVVLDTYRPGVMESLGLGPDTLLKNNPKLIFARLSGYGQYGPLAKRAGHDINYVALTGMLSFLRQSNQKPFPPLNLLGDFAGGGLLCSLGIVMALLERIKSGKGQIVDCNMVEGTAYLSSWLYRSKLIWENVLDGGSHFYNVYETKDGKYVAVGAIEPQFYAKLLKGLELSEDECPQHYDTEIAKNIFSKKFILKTQEEWCKIFDNTDACVTPILTIDEAARHPHNVQRKTFEICNNSQIFIPKPAPNLSRTPAKSHGRKPRIQIGQHTEQILKDLNYTKKEMDELEGDGIIKRVNKSKI